MDAAASPPAVRLTALGDGLGLSHAGNAAVEEAFELGVLSCATLAPVGPWLAEAAELLRDYPHWPVGLLLTLGCRAEGARWGPLAGAAAVPSLVRPTGDFWPELPATATEADVERELRAQAERARAWGVAPRFLSYDGAAHPAVETALSRLAAEAGVPVWPTPGQPQPLALPDVPPGQLTEAVCAALAALTAGEYLWRTRPSQAAPEAWALWGEDEAERRAAELRTLTSPAVRSALRERGIG
jgi:predicted glycoside hydrolase/deacetylase ChbG (UPF0249 family)